MDEAIEMDGSSIIAGRDAAEAIEATFDAIAVFARAGVVQDEELARGWRGSQPRHANQR